MSEHIYQFHNFTLDKNNRELLVDSKSIKVSSKAFDILVYLIERKGKVVSKEELLDIIWGDTFVEESNLPVHISSLRKILNDKKDNSKYIKTIPRVGYIFVAETLKNHQNTKNKIPREANILYLRGKAILESRIVSDNKKQTHSQALNFFRQAIKVEPNYALAYTGIGTTYMSLRNHCLIDLNIGAAKAKKAVQTAMEIDPNVSEAYILKGTIKYMIDKDFQGALKVFDKATELNPQNPDGYHWKGLVFNALAMSEKAIEAANKAIELDPTNLRRSSQLARYYFFAKEFDKSIKHAKEILEFNKGNAAMHFFLMANYTELKMFEPALENANICLKQYETAEHKIFKAYLYSEFDYKDKALQMLDDLLKKFPKEEISNTYLAVLYSSLGEIDKAFELLYKDLAVNSSDLTLMKVDHRFKNLHKDKRFNELLRKLNLL